MTGKSGTRGSSARRRGGDSRSGLWLLLFCLPVLGLMGCRSEASKEKASTVQTEPVEQSNPAADQEKSEAKPEAPAEVKVVTLVPKITVEKPIVDLGEVGTDSKVTGQFPFLSDGQAPLKIVQVHSCCGVAVRGVEPGQEYAPGERGVLEFDYVTGSTPSSPVTRELRMQTNDPQQKFVSLLIKASIVRRVEVEPLRLKLFLKQENAGCGDITIRSLNGKPFSITSFKSTANTISADFDPNAQATEFVLKPKADMEKLHRNVRGVISIDLTHPECGNVRVQYDVLPEFTVNPANLMVFNLRGGQPFQREVWVLGNYRDDFEIESVSSQKGTIKLLDMKKVDNRYQLQLEITVPAQEGDSTWAADMLEVKIKDGDTLSIPFRGFYVGG